MKHMKTFITQPITLRFSKKIYPSFDKRYLAKTGLNRKFPKVVLRGPKKYEEHGDPSLHTRKDYQQLQLLYGHIRNNNEQDGITRQ